LNIEELNINKGSRIQSGLDMSVSGHREGAKNGKGGFINGSGQVDISVNHRCLGRVDT